VRSSSARDEELAPVGVRAAVSHGQESRTVVLVGGQVFVGKGRPVDAELPRACYGRAPKNNITTDAKRKKTNGL
jgi:hypothetical protein